MSLTHTRLTRATAGLLALAACAGPRADAPAAKRAAPAPYEHFPTASEPLALDAEAAEETTLLELVERLAEIGGVHLIVTAESRQLLTRKKIGLTGPIDVPPDEVWSFAQGLLIAGNIALVEIGTGELRLVQVVSLDTNERNAVRRGSLFVAAERIADYADDPALLVSTALEMPHTDVRTLSNSMRTILTDANTQQIVPLGGSSMIYLTGFASDIARLVGTLRLVEEAEARRAEREQAASPTPPPPR